MIRIFYQLFIDFIYPLLIELWSIDGIRATLIGIPVTIITRIVVRVIFRIGRNEGIWFGKSVGILIHYCINSFFIWLVFKIL